MSKKKILIILGIGTTTLLAVAGGTLILLNALHGTKLGGESKTPASQTAPVDPLKQAADYREEAIKKQGEGKHDEAIALLKKARDIYVQQKDAVQQSQTEIDIAAFEDIKKSAPPVVTGVSKASGGE